MTTMEQPRQAPPERRVPQVATGVAACVPRAGGRAGPQPDPPADLLAALDPGLPGQALAAEERLHARGTPGRTAWLITEGIVRCERVTTAGDRRILRLAGPGDLVGQEALLRQAYGDDAVSCTPVVLRQVPASLLTDTRWQAGRLPVALMRRWQDTLEAAAFWSSEANTGCARRRVLQMLDWLQRHRNGQEGIWLPRRDQMGDLLNMTVETCSRVLSALRREGVLVLAPPRHAQLDAARLADAMRLADH